MFSRRAVMNVLMGLVCAAVCATAASSAMADDKAPSKKKGKAPDETAAKEKEKEEKPDFPKFEEFAKDHKAILDPTGETPFFPLHYNAKTDNLLCVIPKKMLDTNFLLASSIAGGPRFAGFMWGDMVVQWQQMNKKLVLIEPDLRYKKGKKSTVEDVISRTYTDFIVLSTPIVCKKGDDPVIDMDKVLKSNFMNIGSVFGGKVDASLSRWAKRKGFPDNIELAVDLAVMNGGQGGQRAQIHYSISRIPDNDYKPRVADDRVGYFMTVLKDWSRPHSDKTVFHRYINRWQVRKEDPDAEVSDVKPEDQIIFYIEKTVPKQYRHYVREGILDWNKAFEKIGLRNAVAVRQQTDSVYADLDPEDVRYNFFRWIVSGRAFAMGPSRANPLTGQILDADIIFDDSFVRSLMTQYARLSAKGPSASYDPQLTEFLTAHPEWAFQPLTEQLLPGRVRYAGMDMSWTTEEMELLASRNQAFCTYAQGLVHETAFAGAIAQAAGGGGLSEEFIGQLLKEVVSHEVGHTLGLRHNFKASSWLSLDKIVSAEGDTPVCGSVMDYNPAMFALNEEDQANFVTTTIGPYDEWAIEYGYRPLGKDQKDEAELLKSITDRVAEEGLDYATDEDTGFFGLDPLVNRYDNGDDPIVYAKHRMEMVQALQKNMADWAVEDGESYNRVRKNFDMLLYEFGRVAGFAARYIGGIYVHRDHKGDPDARPSFEVVPVAKQREALAFLNETIFSDSAFSFEPELLNKLGAGRFRHWDSDSYDSQVDYPIHDRIAATQYRALFHVLNPFTITRIYDAELKVPADQDAMTVPELMTTITAAIWSELKNPVGRGEFTNRQPFISSVRRSLQRQHASVMLNLLLSQPGRMTPADAHSVVRMTLVGLSAQMKSMLDGNGGSRLDDFSKAHLLDTMTRINKALDADFSL